MRMIIRIIFIRNFLITLYFLKYTWLFSTFTFTGTSPGASLRIHGRLRAKIHSRSASSMGFLPSSLCFIRRRDHFGKFRCYRITARRRMCHQTKGQKKQPTVCAMIAQTVGFLRSYFTWFIHLSVSHMIGISYIYQMLWGKSSGNKRLDQKRKGQADLKK